MTVPDTPFMVVHIRRQLKRILSSALFRANKQKGPFLEFLVESAIAGHDITQTDIRNELFSEVDGYEPGSNVVQIAKIDTRALLKDYYDTEGRYDPIKITLPGRLIGPDGKPLRFAPGKAYRPVFERNPRAAVANLLRMGKYFLRKATPGALADADSYFQAVIDKEPGNHDGILGIAEVTCLRSLYCGDSYSPADCLTKARLSLFSIGMAAPPVFKALLGERAELADDFASAKRDEKGIPIPDTARWHTVRGAFYLCRGDFPAAAKSFTEALKLDAEVITNWWFLLFLFLVGQRSHCLFVLKNLSEEEPDSARALTAYVAGMYATRQFDKANDAVTHALKLDSNDWVVRLVAGLVCLARGEGDEAAGHCFAMRLLLETDPFEFMPGLCLLAARMAASVTDEYHGEMKVVAAKVLLETSVRRDWIQIALMHLACGDKDKAADAILKAGEEPILSLYFVPFLPAFDAVRDHPKLKAMMESIAKKTAIEFPLKYLTTGRVVLAQG